MVLLCDYGPGLHLPGNNLDGVSLEFNLLTGAYLAAFAQLELAVDGDKSLCHHLLALASGHHQIGRL